MILPQNSAYRKWFLLGLLVQLVAAWFSVGYNHYDEHFQVLEFCNYKLGLSPASALPWEFATQCRPALQPFMAFCLCKALQAISMYNPFWVAFLLRLMMGMLTWLVTCRMIKLLLPEFLTEKGRQLFVWASFLLWFVPYCGVRFSAENISGLLFFLALSIILQPGTYARLNHTLRLISVGLLMGFVFMLRLQMAFAFLGLALWLLFYSKWHFRDWFIISFFGIVAIGLCVVVDHWFYGTWVLTPYNYYKVNIIQHAAAKFGVYPWWYYFSLFIQYAAPPLSIVLLPLFFIGIWKKPLHLFTWVCVVFIAGHSLIGHKEMRFLLPVTISFIFLSCSGLDWLFSRYPDTWVFRWPVKLFAVINSFVLVAKILTPSHESIPYYKFIYEYSQKQPTTLVSFEESPYQHVDLHTNFYKPGNLHEIVIHNPEELTNILKNANGQSVIFLNPEIDPIPVIALFKKEKLFCLLPDWVRLLNFNDWESRSYIWTIYRLN